MNFKAGTSKKNSFNFGFGRCAQVGKASFLEVTLRRKRRRWAYDFYLVRFRPWDPTNPPFWKKTEHFLTIRSKIVRRLHSSGPVLCHSNTCGLDDLTASSNVDLNLGLNLFHSYFYFVFPMTGLPPKLFTKLQRQFVTGNFEFLLE